MRNAEFLDHLRIVEKILNESVMQEKFIKYKNYPEVRPRSAKESEKFLQFEGQLETVETHSNKKAKPTLEPLLSFECGLTAGLRVTALDFNHQNPDLLLVGYRPRFPIRNDKKGLICFWTVKNSEFPERVIETSSGVATVKFSRRNPNIFGVGLVDGTVAIYDMERSQNRWTNQAHRGQFEHGRQQTFGRGLGNRLGTEVAENGQQ